MSGSAEGASEIFDQDHEVQCGPSLVEFIRSAPDFDALDLERAEDRGREVEL